MGWHGFPFLNATVRLCCLASVKRELRTGSSLTPHQLLTQILPPLPQIKAAEAEVEFAVEQ
jgi:hypothetical protein